MGLTSWSTWSSSQVVLASDLNSQLRDNGRWLSHNATGGAPMCRLRDTSPQGISDSNATAITFDTERFDIGGMHSTVSNQSKITVPTGGGGKYLIGGNVTWQNNATGRRVLQILLNNTTIIGNTSEDAVNGSSTQQTVTTLYHLDATDYVELVVYQTSTGSLNVEAISGSSPEFWAMWVAE